MTAVRRTTTRKKATARKGTGKKSAVRRAAGPKKARRATKAKSPIERLEEQLPPTLAQFSRRVRARLTQLEGKIEKAEARTRRGWTKLLRDGSHQLGLFEARGEAQWRKLTLQARRDVVKLLQRLENALQPPDSHGVTPAPKRTAVRKAAGKKPARSRAAAARATPKERAPAETARGAVPSGGAFEEPFAGERDAVADDDDYEDESNDAFPGESAGEEDLDELLRRGF